MKIERHETGPRMSKAVIHGETVYLAGIVADQIDGFSHWPGPTRRSYFLPTFGSPTWRISLR